jgi:predicted glycosyltransferase
MTVGGNAMSGLASNLDSEQLRKAPLGPAAVTTPSDGSGKIWIDLDNSPHVPFFAPIIEELEQSGHSILLTARDCFQVCELADLLNLSYRRVGRHYGKNPIWKLAGLCWRSLQLIPAVLRDKPVLALSHGSRSQLLVANLLRIPSVTIADYEFARIWMLVHPTWVITPEIIADSAIHARKDHILKYPGIKEDVYVPRFNPDPSVLAKFGVDGKDVIVLVRPPATEAHYHRPESDELFEAVLNFLGGKPQVKMILLPRNERQAADIRSRWATLFATGQILIPNSVVDGLNLIWYSDLVISGGGTMNREAAALGVPVYSIFRGKIGAVDRYLASVERLTLIENLEDIGNKLILKKRNRSSTVQKLPNTALYTIMQHITAILKQTYPEKCQAL